MLKPIIDKKMLISSELPNVILTAIVMVVELVIFSVPVVVLLDPHHHHLHHHVILHVKLAQNQQNVQVVLEENFYKMENVSPHVKEVSLKIWPH